MEKIKNSVLIAGTRLDGSKRLDISLSGVFGLGRSAALALAFEAIGVDPKDKAHAGVDLLSKLPKLSALDDAALSALGAKLAAMEVEGALCDKLRAQERDKMALAKSLAKSKAVKA